MAEPTMGEKTKQLPKYPQYLQNGGEMGELIRNFDWCQTSIGDPITWSHDLLTTLGIILGSKFPMFLWWGDDQIQFYNDAYRPSFGNQGKHPMALGQRGEDCWPEIWPAIKPLINQVLKGGNATWQEDSLIPIYRNGNIEDVYWTFSYSRVIDSYGAIGGVLVTCFETTDKINIQQQNKKTLLELAESEKRLRQLISQAPVAIGVLRNRDLVVETANKKLLGFWGKTEDMIGQRLADALPELRGQPFLKLLDDVYTSGKGYSSSEHPATLEHNGVLRQYYFDLLYQPIHNEAGSTESILVVATDMTEQVNARHNIEESSMQFRQLADSITQMVWIADAEGMHEYYNKRWFDFTGSDFNTVKGEGWSQMFHPDDREGAKKKWKHSLRTGEQYEVEYRLKSNTGEYLWVLGRAAPFYDTKGKITKWFGTCTDINAQKLLLEQKDDFIGIASHELKTPLTSLKAFMQMIKRAKGDSMPPSLTKLLDSAGKSADRIYELVEDLLDTSKINHGGLILDIKNFSLSEMIDGCCEHLTIEGNYTVVTIGDLNLRVDADLERIHQVVTNFVSNAIKYAPGSKEVLVKIEQIDKAAKVSVMDKGPGIAKDKIPHLFDRYYRVGETSNKSGLGLGLYICAEIIKKHGGEIGAESIVGKGSTFWFTLPTDYS